MINVLRGNEAPASLTTEEIQNYIDECILHKNDPENQPKPKKPTSYRTSDLLEAFDTVFFSKCYLTEEAFANSWKLDVEHFIPQNENPELVYEWTNLFPAEHGANMRKPRSSPDGGYLDPCDPKDDVENEIVYAMGPLGFIPAFEARNQTNTKAVNTAELLKRLHNGIDSNSVNATKDLRHQIHKLYVLLLEKICEWQLLEEGTQEEVQLRTEIKQYLSRKSSFTMLVRSIPAVRRLPETFFD